MGKKERKKQKNGAIFRLYHGADTIVFLSPLLDGGSKVYIHNIHAAKNPLSSCSTRKKGIFFQSFYSFVVIKMESRVIIT